MPYLLKHKGITHELVGVPTLETLCIRSSLCMLETACTAADFDRGDEARRLRDACVLSIPWLLRQRLVEELLKSGRLHDTLQLRVLEVLLYPDVRRLAIRHVRRWYRSRFLDLLASGQAAGLQVLLLEDDTWFTGSPVMSTPLASAIRYLPHLRQVSLRYVCDDVILGSLGSFCPHLLEIDICGSMGVSDVGVQKICIQANVWKKSASVGAKKMCLCLNSVTCAVRGVFLSCFLEDALNLQNSLPGWWRNGIIKHACKNPCCKTLRSVNLTSTRVTYQGVRFFQSCAPQVKVNLTNLQ